jgi:hypothetical protein
VNLDYDERGIESKFSEKLIHPNASRHS